MSEFERGEFEAALGEIINGLGPVSLEAQQGALYDVISRFEQEWEDTGITATLRAISPLEDIDHITLHRAHYFDDPRGVAEEHYFQMTGTARIDDVSRRAFVKVPVSQIIRGKQYTMPGFTDGDATCIAGQIDQLDDLKEEGILPNLSEGLGFIVEPDTGIVLPPKK